jgi:hypothetical protein
VCRNDTLSSFSSSRRCSAKDNTHTAADVEQAYAWTETRRAKKPLRRVPQDRRLVDQPTMLGVGPAEHIVSGYAAGAWVGKVGQGSRRR